MNGAAAWRCRHRCWNLTYLCEPTDRRRRGDNHYVGLPRWPVEKASASRAGVCWLLNVRATCECISGTDLLSFMCYHTETEVADLTFYLVQSQYTSSSSSSYARWRCLLPSRRWLSSSAPPGCHTACPSVASDPAMCPAS